jgi:prepilin-type N-terminal cleavage/methylation domain-containing protein
MKRGLTIIEVLVALTILALLGAVTTPLLVSSMQLNGEGRIRAQAITATESWLDRFRAKTLNFGEFDRSNGRTFAYGFDYANDSRFVAAGDPNPQALNQEWQPYKFQVITDEYNNDPLTWRVTVVTTYKNKRGGEVSFDVQTLITQ